MDSLNDSQKAFAKEYVTHWNGTKAYQTAYPKSSYESAKVNASKLLTNTNIQQHIESIQKDLSKLCGVSVLSNVNLLLEIINSDLTERPSDKIKAIEVINKLLGFNAPDKTETKLEEVKASEPCRITFTRK